MWLIWFWVGSSSDTSPASYSRRRPFFYGKNLKRSFIIQGTDRNESSVRSHTRSKLSCCSLSGQTQYRWQSSDKSFTLQDAEPDLNLVKKLCLRSWIERKLIFYALRSFSNAFDKLGSFSSRRTFLNERDDLENVQTTDSPWFVFISRFY